MAAITPKRKKPRYVLIIEDNVNHAELLTEILDRHFAPIIIHTVDTIKDGIEFASQLNYDLILSAAVIHEEPISPYVRKLARLAGTTPIIVISGRGDERLAAELIKLGVTEYFSKTRETLEQLASIFEKHLRHKRRAKQPHADADRSLNPGTPSPAELVREVDRLTQHTLAMAAPRRRKRGHTAEDMEQLDRLLDHPLLRAAVAAENARFVDEALVGKQVTDAKAAIRQ